MAQSEQFRTRLLVIAVPDHMPKAADPPRNDLQPGRMFGAERINPAQRLLDVLNPHGNMPPIKNAAHRFASGRTDQARQCCFAVADDCNGVAALPSLFLECLAQRRQRRFRALGRKSKPPGRLPRYFDLAHRDVDMPRLVAVSRSDMRAVIQDDHLCRRIDYRLGFRRRERSTLEINRDTMRSIARGRVVDGVARQEHGQQPGRLPVGMPGAQFRLHMPELGRASVR
jgi:hypothetical protein